MLSQQMVVYFRHYKHCNKSRNCHIELFLEKVITVVVSLLTRRSGCRKAHNQTKAEKNQYHVKQKHIHAPLFTFSKSLKNFKISFCQNLFSLCEITNQTANKCNCCEYQHNLFFFPILFLKMMMYRRHFK